MAKGPAGPASAVSGLNYILFTVIEAILHRQCPRTLEITGLIIGIIGAMIVVVPTWFEAVFIRINFFRHQNVN